MLYIDKFDPVFLAQPLLEGIPLDRAHQRLVPAKDSDRLKMLGSLIFQGERDLRQEDVDPLAAEPWRRRLAEHLMIRE